MGRSTTPTYIVKTFERKPDGSTKVNKMAWSKKGKPTAGQAEDFRRAYNLSFLPGLGVNSHVSKALGYVPHASKVEVWNQKTSQLVATAVMPMFEVVG
jgi:hypothetical protein